MKRISPYSCSLSLGRLFLTLTVSHTSSPFLFRAGILWLGNIKPVAKGDGSGLEDTTALENAAKILKCNKDDLEKSILFKKISTKTESYTIPVWKTRVGYCKLFGRSNLAFAAGS